MVHGEEKWEEEGENKLPDEMLACPFADLSRSAISDHLSKHLAFPAIIELQLQSLLIHHLEGLLIVHNRELSSAHGAVAESRCEENRPDAFEPKHVATGQHCH